MYAAKMDGSTQLKVSSAKPVSSNNITTEVKGKRKF